MRCLILLAVASLCACADARGGAGPTPAVLKGDPPPEIIPAATIRAVTADDLQNLVICARRSLPSLTAEELSAVAVSIKHAEEAIAAMRQPPEQPKPEAKKP